MAGIPKAGSDARDHLKPVLVNNRLKPLQAGRDIGPDINRRYWLVAPTYLAFVEILDLDLLDVCRIRQHDACEIRCCGSGEDWPPEALFDEFWQQPAMVDVRMAQDDGCNIPRLERKGPVIEFLLRLRALKQTTVDEYLPAQCFQPET